MLQLSLRRILFYSLAFLYAGSLYSQATSEKQVIKTIIRLHESVNFTPAFFFSDEFNDTSPPFLLSVKKKEQQIEIENPILLFNADTGVPFYVLPGEVIYVMPPSKNIRLLTSLEERNNELAFFAEFNKRYPDYFQTNSSISLGKKIKSVVYPAAQKSENEKEQKALDFLERYQKEKSISTQFYLFAKRFFHYLKTANLFTILSSSSIQIENPPTFRDVNDIDYSNDYTCDSCLNNIAYRLSVYAYRQYLVKNLKIDHSGYLENAYNLTETAFAGKTKEFLLFIMFKEQLSKGLNVIDNPNFKRYIVGQNDDNLEHIDYLKKEIYFRSSAAGKKELLNAANATDSWDDVIIKDRGKLIFVDFWASWCAPCRLELPDSKKLALDYQQQQLKILFISVDRNYNDWIKAVRLEKLDTYDSYIMTNFEESEIKRRFNIMSLPRYILIDKQGNIIDDHAPSPHTSELKQLIKKYL